MVFLISLVVNVSQNVLDFTEILEQCAARLEDFSAENVLFSIDSEVWEAFLRGV